MCSPTYPCSCGFARSSQILRVACPQGRLLQMVCYSMLTRVCYNILTHDFGFLARNKANNKNKQRNKQKRKEENDKRAAKRDP